MTLKDFIQTHLQGDAGNGLRLTSPALIASGAGKTLYMPKPPALEKATRINLEQPLPSLITDGEEITVTDPVFPQGVGVEIAIKFSN
eukprot:CAMPEP_0113942566 /NCGR_PEP_ID=MMETSP1339-20121228/8257_1 /TAXON_ID=94617 /ORGANISM="Fibrocapsa japonica" /LENGTH=86 /DNA_ID=CAMNT_0000947085 /DNA_START=7 /DNA_END=267 /DNA_ORIENTATION=+ /assembly_acc=CAM_ASM_000762